MGRPGNVYEYDAYHMVNVPKDRTTLSKEKEDKLVEEMKERIRKGTEEQEAKQKKVV